MASRMRGWRFGNEGEHFLLSSFSSFSSLLLTSFLFTGVIGKPFQELGGFKAVEEWASKY